MKNIPRCEHPRPDRRREDWLSLNGEWDFEIDNARVGVEKKFYLRDSLDSKIIVPFCPESELSGLAHLDFMNGVWYRRGIEIPKNFEGKRVFLHIEACDWETVVYVNGKKITKHKGGYTPISADITNALREENNYVTIYAEDDVRSGKQPGGKQSTRLDHYGCHYTRNTGIWQSVWLEAREAAHAVCYRAYPDVTNTAVTLTVRTSAAARGKTLNVKAYYEGRPMGDATATVMGTSTTVSIKLSEEHLWEAGCGRLYDLDFEVVDGEKVDTLHGYFGLREVGLTKRGFTLNGKTIFLRTVLDQGYYPDGIVTAPSDEALIFDIKASMDSGFNGARLHQKIFEPRFLYHADRLGYLVFEETGNWCFNHTDSANIYTFLPEWMEAVERDFSHPSIIGWCPFNETWDLDGKPQANILLDTVYDVTKALDSTRPTITVSGSFPTERTDMHDVHEYEQDPEKFREIFAHIKEGSLPDQLYRKYGNRQKCKNYLPIFVSEFGGIKWVMGATEERSWGYGKDVTTPEEFFARLEGLVDVLCENDEIIGFCYTQLYDVELEQNGFLTYDRQFKFPAEEYKKIITKKSVIEN